MSAETVRLKFSSCLLTAYGGTDGKGIEVWLDVTCHAQFLRDAQWECAFCHGDPCAEHACRQCGGGYMQRQESPHGQGG